VQSPETGLSAILQHAIMNSFMIPDISATDIGELFPLNRTRI